MYKQTETILTNKRKKESVLPAQAFCLVGTHHANFSKRRKFSRRWKAVQRQRIGQMEILGIFEVGSQPR